MLVAQSGMDPISSGSACGTLLKAGRRWLEASTALSTPHVSVIKSTA
jgi:hypothetical protein